MPWGPAPWESLTWWSELAGFTNHRFPGTARSSIGICLPATSRTTRISIGRSSLSACSVTAIALCPFRCRSIATRSPSFGAMAIGCERCHGPGELHVRGQEWSMGGISPSSIRVISSPRSVEPFVNSAISLATTGSPSWGATRLTFVQDFPHPIFSQYLSAPVSLGPRPSGTSIR